VAAPLALLGVVLSARTPSADAAGGVAAADTTPAFAATRLPTIALGTLTDFRAGPAAPARWLSGLLAAPLGRAGGVHIVPLHAPLLLPGGAPDASGATLGSVARRAGAQELLEGALHARPSGRLRLDLSRVDLATGVVRGAFTIEGDDLAVLLDSAALRLAAELRASAGAGLQSGAPRGDAWAGALMRGR
jgi:hypothetical protein